MSKKDRIQLTALGVVILIVFSFVAYTYRDKFLPDPVGDGIDYSVSARPETPVSIDSGLFSRPDYSELRHYGEVKIVPPDTAGADYRLPSPYHEIGGDEETIPQTE